jgi:hypothetical protein
MRVTTTSARVFSANETRPSTTNWRATPTADGSTNCGMNARKKAAVIGFKALTTAPSRKARPGPMAATSNGAAAARASRTVLKPSQSR